MMKSIFNRLLSTSSGFTLAETLVALSIMGLGLGLVGSGIFQSLVIERVWVDDVIATKDIRHADSWFSKDALNAHEVCDPALNARLVPGGASIGSMTFVWYEFTDANDLPVTYCDGTLSANFTRNEVTYVVVGKELQRITVIDGVQIAQNSLTRRVVSASFSLSASGDVLSFDLEVEAEEGVTEFTSLQTFLRKLRA